MLDNTIFIKPKTHEELSIIYHSITHNLNGLTLEDASAILDHIKMEFVQSQNSCLVKWDSKTSIVNFRSDRIYDPTPCQGKEPIRVFIA